MKKFLIATTLGMTLGLSSLAVQAQTNEQTRKDAAAQTKQDRKASKAQAKADKKTQKALESGKVKDAARSQDKADAAAAKANSN